MKLISVIIVKLFLLTCFSAFLATCSSRSTSSAKSYTIYFIFAPKTVDQAKLAKSLLINAKENNGTYGSTQVITANNSYVVAELCQRNTPDFLKPNIKLDSDSNPDVVTKEAEKSFKDVISGTKNCIADSSSLVEISNNLSQASSELNQSKIIVFLQAPWSRDEISDETLKDLKKVMDKIAASNRVERFVLFGVDPNGADKLAMSFHSIKNQLRISSRVGDTVEHLKAVRKDYLH